MKQQAIRALPFVLILLVLAAGLAITFDRSWTVEEIHLLRLIGANKTPALNTLAATIDAMFSATGAIVGSLAAGALFGALTRSLRRAVRVTVLVGGGWLLSEAAKWIVQRPAPDSGLIVRSSRADPLLFSFPSGHAALAVAVLTTTLILVPPLWRAVLVVPGILLAIVVAWSRLYLGVHYPSDVVASMILTPSIVVLLDRLVLAFQPRRAVTTRLQEP